MELKFAVPWSKAEFFEQAKALSHPFVLEAKEHAPGTREAVEKAWKSRPEEVMRWRDGVLDRWEARKAQLAGAEAKLHDLMPKEVARIYAGKNFLVLKEMLRFIGWPDVTLVDDLVRGMPLVGSMPLSGVFALAIAVSSLPLLCCCCSCYR